jgi:RNA polymerase sigma-70 factor (sigma-E family)
VVDEPAGVETRVSQDPLRVAFERHHLPLLRMCLLLTGRREDAEEIVQEAFVRVAPRIAGLEPDAVGPYLRRTAVNVWKNRLRRLRLELRARSAGLSQPAASVSPPEDRDEVWEAVGRLPPRRRACVVLRYYEDLSERETARVLGCSVGTVKSQTSRALARLRKELERGSRG